LKLYYEDRILPAVAECVKVMGEDHPPLIKVIREVTKEMLDGEDDEIKAIVAAKVAAAENVAIDGDDRDSSTRTPQQYQE
jgi:hypothetical protein